MKIKVFSILLTVIIITSGLLACTQPEANQPDIIQPAIAGILVSDKSRITQPQTSQDDLNTLVNGNSEFAFDLYQALKNTDSNLFLSPYSISQALAMTYVGAREETEQEMADILHFTLPQSILHSSFNGLDSELSTRGEGAAGKDGQGFRLNIVNAIWGQKDCTFLPDYLDVLAENYGAGLRTLDFVNQAEESRITINDWVSDETEGKIPDILAPGIINDQTRLILTNAIYFNAAWKYPFTKAATYDSTFYLLDGSKISVPMMKITEKFGYTEGDKYQAVELLYDGNELSMVIILPEEGQFKAFENEMNYQLLQETISNIELLQTSLWMPKFKYESEFNLKNTLASMGMPIAFSRVANFSGITGEKNLFIDEVIHKAFVAVDEAGTEAAAATAISVKEITETIVQKNITIDRPFIFLIRDIKTNSILFIGRVLNPGS